MTRPSRLVYRLVLALGLSLTFSIGACSTPAQTQALQSQWPADLPDKANVGPVKFFAQTEHECGPAALAMMMFHAGVDIKPEALTSEVYVPGRQGAFQPEMAAAARRQGLLAHVIAPQLHDLLEELAAGNPVLVFQNLSVEAAPVWHYAVAVGYDRQAGQIILHTGQQANQPLSLSVFERTWARGKHWAMLVLPADKMPATADPSTLTPSLVALERGRPDAARIAYFSALTHWPDQAVWWLGLGNTAYAAKNLGDALGSYQEASRRDPRFADAWNNQAQVQLELKQPAAALQAIDQAIRIGGPRLADYQALRERIQAALAKGGSAGSSPGAKPATKS